MARILLLSLVFPPDGVSTAHLMGELVTDLSKAGHQVRVLTTTPHYNRDEQAEASQPLRWKVWPLMKESVHGGVTAYHIPMPRKGKGLVARALSWLMFHALSVVLGAPLARWADVILAPSPPLTIGLSARALSALGSCRYVYNVQEVYPDVAVKLGLLRNRGLIRILEGVGRAVYRNAAAITVISEGMRDSLREKGVPTAKLRLIPNWVDLDVHKPTPKDNPFSREHGLTDKFVVSYAGNLGPTQGLDRLIEAAAELRDQPAVQILIVGGGSEYDRLRTLVEEDGLTNVTLLPYQPYETVPEIYGASDLCVVPQHQEISGHAVPSKVYRILASARPILSLASTDSELARLVEEADAGIIVDMTSAAGLAAAIRDAAGSSEQWREAGVRGRAFVRERYSRSVVTGRYASLLSGVADATG